MLEEKIEEYLSQQFKITGSKKETNQEVLKKLKESSKNSESFSFDDIQNFNKSKLNKTETHITSLTDVIATEEIYTINSSCKSKPQGSTSHVTQAEIKEHFDAIETIEMCVDKIVKMIKTSKHFVVYTGAGISTSANIPDYRGPNGVWTLRDKGMRPEGLQIDQAFPTYSHYALVELMKQGILKYVVSTK